MAARRVAIAASVGLAVVVASPVVTAMHSALTREKPQELDALKGSWSGEDQDRDLHTLRFNRFGMAAYEGPFGSHKGPVKIMRAGQAAVSATGSELVPVVVEIEPLLPFLGDEALQLRAELEYPTAGDSRIGSVHLRTAAASAELRKAR